MTSRPAGSTPAGSTSIAMGEPSSKKDAIQGIVDRWGGREEAFSEGFLAVPVSLLRNLASIGEYGITPTEAVFVLEVMSFKWGAEDPFPSYRSIAESMGVSEAYVRKIARRLEEKGFLNRRSRQGTTNKFDFSPLFEKIAELGEEDDEMELPF